jgi:hypothetical protein
MKEKIWPKNRQAELKILQTHKTELKLIKNPFFLYRKAIGPRFTARGLLHCKNMI